MMPQQPHKSSAIEAMRFLLIIAGVLAILCGTAAAFIVVTRFEAPAERLTLLAMAALGGGFAIGLLLFALAAMLSLHTSQLHQARQLVRSIEHLRGTLTSIQPPSPPPAAAPVAAVPPTKDPLNEQLAFLQFELRDLAFMNDTQRRAAAAHHWAQRKRAILADIDRAMSLGEWGDANAHLETLRQIAPDDPNVAAVEARIAGERNARLEGDIAAAQNQLRHAMSISAWEQADDVVMGLHKKYPAAAEVQELADSVEREREAFNRELADRLFLDLASATEHRHWKRALEIGDDIVRRYPTDQRVEKLEHDLATIRDNAAAQERKEQEEAFKDLLKRQRYHEALEVARTLIDKYPTSPAAAELLRIIPKVEDLLRAEQARRKQNSTQE